MFRILTILLASIAGWAAASEDVQVLLQPKEKEIRERAKKRLYPGGIDEEPLKVQAQLPVAQRKMVVQEASEPVEEDSEVQD